LNQFELNRPAQMDPDYNLILFLLYLKKWEFYEFFYLLGLDIKIRNYWVYWTWVLLWLYKKMWVGHDLEYIHDFISVEIFFIMNIKRNNL